MAKPSEPLAEQIKRGVKQRTRNPQRITHKKFGPKLTEADSAWMVQAYLDHVSIGAMARKLGVNQKTVSKHIRNHVIPFCRRQMGLNFWGHIARIDNLIRLGFQDWRQAEDPSIASIGAQMVRWGMEQKAKLARFEPPQEIVLTHDYRVAGLDPEEVDRRMLELLTKHAQDVQRGLITVDAGPTTHEIDQADQADEGVEDEPVKPF